MSTAPIATTETPIVPRRRSRRIWLLSLAGFVVLAVGWTYLVVMDRQTRSNKAAQNKDQRQTALLIDDSAPFANQPLLRAYSPYTVQNVPSSTAPVAQNNPQYRQSVTTYYANPIQPEDPAENAATNEINQLRNQLRAASGEQKKELRKSLIEAVGKLFDLRHAAQAKQVEKLETELAEAKDLLKKRGERKDEIVERRIAELLQSADDLAWNREIAGKSNPATIYNVAPNAYAPPMVPNNIYTVPPSGNYPNGSNPYGTAPNLMPGTLYSNPLPPSSTPPQFIPLNTQDSGQTSLLQSVPRATSGSRRNTANPRYSDSTYDAPTIPPDASAESTVQKNDAISASAGAANPEVASNNELLTQNPQVAITDRATASTIVSDPLTSSTISSRAVIEAAYAYEEALDVEIESKKLSASGAVSSRELSTATRAVRAAKDIWASMLRDLANQLRIKKQEFNAQQILATGNMSREKRTALLAELEKIKFSLQSIEEAQSWADNFNKQSIDPLEKKLEQNTVIKVEEKKSEAPNDPVGSE